MVTTPLLLLLQLAHAEEPAVRVGGFVEGYYTWNLNQPTNHVNALRGFDDRHNSLTLSLASAHIAAVDDVARGIIALQTGTVPAALYATEPTGAGAFASTGAQQLSIVREAWGGATLARGLTLDAGVFLSPVGFDGAAAKDNRFWSLSNLGVGLPFYLTGVRLSAPLGENTTLTGGVFNGWNRIFDDNEGKTVGLWVDHQFAQGARLHALYIGGAEGAGDRPWRHTVDVWADLPPRPGESLGRRDRRARATRGRPGALRGGAARGERAGDGVLGRWRPSRRVPRGRQRRRSRRDLLANVVARRGDRRRDAPARAGGDRAA